MPDFPPYIANCKSLLERQRLMYKAIKKLTKYTETMDLPRIKLYLLVIIEGLDNKDIKECIDKMINECIRCNLIGAVIKIIKYLHNKKAINDDVLYPIFRFANTIICNILELNHQICYQVIQNRELIDIYMFYATDESIIDQVRYVFTTEFRKLYSYKLLDRHKRDHIVAARHYNMLITTYFIIHNINIYIDVGEEFNDENLKRMMIKAIDSIRSDYLGMSAYSTLVVIVKDHEFNLLDIGERYAKIIVGISRFLVRKDDNVSSEFRLWEVLNWLYISLRNELMYCNIIKAQFIDVLLEIFQKDSKTDKEDRLAKLCLERIFDECINCGDTENHIYALRTVDLTQLRIYLYDKFDSQFKNRMRIKMSKIAF